MEAARAAGSKIGPEHAKSDRRSVHEEILSVLEALSVRPYDDIVIERCDGNIPKCFSDVDIRYANRGKKPKTGVRFGELYCAGMKIIKNFDKNTKGSEEYISLLDFLEDSDKDAEAISQVFDSTPSETEVTAVLAVHLFSKIAPKSDVYLDETMPGLTELLGQCPCKCDETFKAESIGIGSPEVWHGYSDIEVDSVAVSVVARELEDEELSDENDNDAPSSAKKKKAENTESIAVESKKDSPEDVIRRVIAQTITNSFVQVQFIDGLSKKFIPSILCSPKGIQVFAYNVKNDFLLSTLAPLPILETGADGAKKLCILTVLEIWLALHVHFTGCDADSFAGDLGLAKCGFKKQMEESSVLKFYKTAEQHVKAFPPEKERTKFHDLLHHPLGTIYLKPLSIEPR